MFNFIITVFILAAMAMTPYSLHGGYGAASLEAVGSFVYDRKAEIEKKLWSADELNFAALETSIVRGMQHQPSSAYYHYLLAMLYLRQFQHDPTQDTLINKAMMLAQQALQLQPRQEFGYLALASLHEALDELGKAKVYLDNLTKSVTQSSLSWRYYLMRARIMLAPETLDDSLEMLRTAIMKQDTLTDAVVPHVILLLEFKYADSPDLLLSAVQKWQELRPHRLYRQYIATVKLEQGDYQLALQDFKSILADDPNNNNAKLNIALISYKHLDNKQEAKSIFTSLAEDKSTSKQEQSALHIHLGNIFLQEKNYLKAQQHFINTVLSNNDRSALLQYVFILYHQRGLYRQLTNLIKKLNIELPGHPHHYALLGNLYADYLQDHPNAIEAYSNALLLDPSQGKLYSALGLSYYKLNNLEQALTMFNKARTYDTSDAMSFYNEACVYSLLKRQNEAIASLQRAIELDESLKTHAMQDADFDNIRSLPTFSHIVN